MYKRYVKESGDPKIPDKVMCLQNKLNSIIESKQKYYSNNLIDPMTSIKFHCLRTVRTIWFFISY